MKITIDELHSFVIGWSEAICFWKPRFPMPEIYPNPLEEEFHYYMAGRATGLLTLIGLNVFITIKLFSIFTT